MVKSSKARIITITTALNNKITERKRYSTLFDKIHPLTYCWVGGSIMSDRIFDKNHVEGL